MLIGQSGLGNNQQHKETVAETVCIHNQRGKVLYRWRIQEDRKYLLHRADMSWQGQPSKSKNSSRRGREQSHGLHRLLRSTIPLGSLTGQE